MNRDDAQDREIQALRDRLARLSEVSLRINESLELDAVLQGVLDSARSLTGASYGAFVLLDDSGQIEDFLASGLTAEEAQTMWSLADGMRFFEYLSGTGGPLRLPEMLGTIRAQGLPDLQPPVEVGASLPLLVAPVIHLGQRVGHIFLAERESGGEFGPEEELRARADLETLIDTTPVGVVVFVARTGAPVSVNREMKRISDGLRGPDQPPEHLLGGADRPPGRRQGARLGRAAPIPGAERPRDGAGRGDSPADARRPERQGADQRHPHRLRGGPRGILRRDRTGYDVPGGAGAAAGRVPGHGEPHDLRTPVKGSVSTLLDPPSLLSASEMRQFLRIIEGQMDRMHVLISDLLDVARAETGALAVSLEATDVAARSTEPR